MAFNGARNSTIEKKKKKELLCKKKNKKPITSPVHKVFSKDILHDGFKRRNASEISK